VEAGLNSRAEPLVRNPKNRQKARSDSIVETTYGGRESKVSESFRNVTIVNWRADERTVVALSTSSPPTSLAPKKIEMANPQN
jgi:hypothetical protein